MCIKVFKLLAFNGFTVTLCVGLLVLIPYPAFSQAKAKTDVLAHVAEAIAEMELQQRAQAPICNVPAGAVRISAPQDLLLIGSNPSAYLYLANDIDLNGAEIYNIDVEFSGTLDGCGHALRNLTVSSYQPGYPGLSGMGLVRRAAGATFKDLSMLNARVTLDDPNQIDRDAPSGVLVGVANGTIFENVTVQGSLFDLNVDQGTGLLAGEISNSILRNITAVGSVNIASTITGGIAGSVNSSTLDQATLDVALVGKSSAYEHGAVVGGAIGRYTGSGTLANIHGRVKIHGAQSAGGIVGETYSSQLTISDIHLENSQILSTYWASAIGGFIGEVDSPYNVPASLTLERAYFDGRIRGTGYVGGAIGTTLASNELTSLVLSEVGIHGTVAGDREVGGLMAASDSLHKRIENSYVQANLGFWRAEADSNAQEVGGIAAVLYSSEGTSSIESSYLSGSIRGVAPAMGAILAEDYANTAVVSTYYNASVLPAGFPGGLGESRSESEMRNDPASYTGFDFVNIWTHTPGQFATLQSHP